MKRLTATDYVNSLPCFRFCVHALYAKIIIDLKAASVASVPVNVAH